VLDTRFHTLYDAAYSCISDRRTVETLPPTEPMLPALNC
jgi:hypothetical protein